MPLTEKGQKILTSMKKQYGPEKGEQVFYASKNAGKLTGVDDSAYKIEVKDALTEKGHKILHQMREQYGYEGGNTAFNKARKEGKISGVERDDDNQHLGFTKGTSTPVEKLVSAVDALAARIDAFEQRQHQRKPEEVKPRTKDNMQPSDPHPKEVRLP
jgi:hypothetical protein